MRFRFLPLIIALSACSREHPVRLVAGVSDTVIVNSRSSVRLSLSLVGVDGVERPTRDVRFQVVVGDALRIDATGQLSCQRSGDAKVLARHNDLQKYLTVLCRPVHRLRPSPVRLTLGGPAQALDLGARGFTHEPLDHVVGTAVVRDTLVVALVGGYLVPRGRGVTMVDVEVGDCSASILIEVLEPTESVAGLLAHQQYSESLVVSGGELRHWRLAPGRYDIALSSASEERDRLRLASYMMSCANLGGPAIRYRCIAKEGAALIAYAFPRSAHVSQSKAVLLVQRLGDVGTDPHVSGRAAADQCWSGPAQFPPAR